MANLKKEYIDIRNNQHRVEHFMVSNEENIDRKQITQELFYVLTKTNRRIRT